MSDPIRLVVVEMGYSESNPGLKSLVMATRALAARGYEIEAWCTSIDEGLEDVVKFRRIASPALPGPIGGMAFWFLALVVGAWRRMWKRDEGRVVYLTTGGKYWFADVSMFQFYNPSWLGIQKRIRYWGPENRLRRWMALWGAFEDWGMLVVGRCRRIISASRAIRDDLEQDLRGDCWLGVLPNCVDRSRFARGRSDEWREAIRGELGYGEKETVLLFVSMGHFVRKGLWLAVETLSRLRERGEKDFRLLVAGGYPRKLEQNKRYLDRVYPRWEEWIHFTGMTDQVPQLMSASDGLFFPSYFEAFSLVEIEAAAMGLPLILTRHHGSEMILREGRNGIYVSFEPDEIGERLLAFRERGLEVPAIDMGEALDVGEWAAELDGCLRAMVGERDG
ncbi:MAG: glycosyltransferase family 4 protein [Verrucomicrobiota bacterium]